MNLPPVTVTAELSPARAAALAELCPVPPRIPDTATDADRAVIAALCDLPHEQDRSSLNAQQPSIYGSWEPLGHDRALLTEVCTGCGTVLGRFVSRRPDGYGRPLGLLEPVTDGANR